MRRIQFTYPPDTDPAWTPAAPEFACAANSISLLMPAMEPYFVRSVAAGLPELDPDLAATTRSYLGQESQHHHQHQIFNRLLIERYRGLVPIERLANSAYRNLERRGSAMFNLAFAATSETIAYSAARWAEGRRSELFEQADPLVSSLFLWHLAEEVEHKSVAFDVERALNGRLRRPTKILATVMSLVLVMLFVALGTTVMLWSERRLFHPIAWFRLTRWAVSFVFELLPNLLYSLSSHYHPSDLIDPLWYELWLQEFDAEAKTLPLWDSVTDR